MKNISLKICLVIVALSGVVNAGAASDVPDCIGDSTDFINSFCIDLHLLNLAERSDRVGAGAASDLPDCIGDSLNSCFGSYTWTNGDKYVGELKDRKADGQGAYILANGSTLVGAFKGGKADGQGTLTYFNGTYIEYTYVGEFKDDKFNGQGTATYESGDKYVGEWKDNKRNGQGTSSNTDGDYFNFTQNLHDWKMQNDNWLTILGNYSGEWSDNRANGQGTTTFDDGSTFTGQWKDGEFNGLGILTVLNMGTLSGEFKGWEAFNGHFTQKMLNGDEYVGGFKDGNKNGRGTYTFADGRKYIGEWKDGNKSGRGVFIYLDGTIKEGIWKGDKFQFPKEHTKDDEVISASSGSGFAVSSDGYVITNNHVTDGCQEVMVHTQKSDVRMKVITYDTQNDLALLKGDFTPSFVFPLSTNSPELLQEIYVAGYPFGHNISTSVKVTKGIISSLTGIGNNFSHIQIDAALQRGNSGGPVVDDMGNVVGVAVAKIDAKYMFEHFGSIPENTNFGIKSSVVRSVLDSSSVDIPAASKSPISKSQLGKMITDGTYYISCWMTIAQIEKVRSKKVLFSELD